MSSDGDRLIFLSLKPKYAQAIVGGSKTIELRRQPPRIHAPTKAVLYASSPQRVVVGRCTVTAVVELAPEAMWQEFGSLAGISQAEFESYFVGKLRTYGLLLADVEALDDAVSLEVLRSKFEGFTPPQNFRYFPISALDDLTGTS